MLSGLFISLILYHFLIFHITLSFQSVIYGYFDFSSWKRVEPSRLYKMFHEASLQALSEDPNREIAFAVISDEKVARALNISLHEIHLRMWNQTLVSSDLHISNVLSRVSNYDCAALV